MKRLKSKKKVLSLGECCRPFSCVFINANSDGKVFVSSNGKSFYYPLGVEVSIEDFGAWFVLKEANATRNFFIVENYNPFEA